MLKLFGRFVIGGRTGKREQAWAVFILWCAAFVWFAAKEAAGASLEGTQAILTLALPLVIGNLITAYGMEWASSQTKWGDSE
tara:strand:+ start:298 stop:543 length:246 start_codon:yes stop_codon:yes gene_type:complete